MVKPAQQHLCKLIEVRLKELGMPLNFTTSLYWDMERGAAFRNEQYILVVRDNQESGYITAELRNPKTGEAI